MPHNHIALVNTTFFFLLVQLAMTIKKTVHLTVTRLFQDWLELSNSSFHSMSYNLWHYQNRVIENSTKTKREGENKN